jgi:ferredoxin
MQTIRAHYADKGIEDLLHSEEFVLDSAVPVATDDVSGEVRFARAGSSAANTGATLLEQAEAAGLEPEYGCRMGICFSCTQTKLAGCTRNVRDGELNSDPDTEIQLCINVPVGDVELDI